MDAAMAVEGRVARLEAALSGDDGSLHKIASLARSIDELEGLLGVPTGRHSDCK